MFASLAVKTSQGKQIIPPEDDWLVKTNRFLIGGFVFMLDIDWIAKKQLNVNSMNVILKGNQNSIT